MADIPLNARGKRTQFFDEKGMDAMVTMTTELMTELWVVKERMYVLEKVLGEKGVSVSDEIENIEFSATDKQKIEAVRRNFVETIMRALNSNWQDSSSAQNEIDELTAHMTESDNTSGRS